MREFIEKEKSRLQKIFEPFNAQGSWMRLTEPGRGSVRLGMIDSYLVTRVAPVFHASGEVKRVEFWLLFKAIGYDEGFQHSHTIKVVRWSQEDTYLIDLIDDRGRRFHAELIFPGLEPELAAGWEYWQRYRRENRGRFSQIDAEILEEHIQIAEEWE